MMGSGFYTYEEAAKVLKKHKRSITNYINRGWLRREVDGDRVGVNAVDVNQMAEDLGITAPPLNRKTITDMQMQIRRLQERMAVHDARAGIDTAPLRPGEVSAKQLYGDAVAFLKMESWPDSLVEAWLDLFPRFDERDFDMIAEATLSTHPWVPFFNLCRAMEEQAERKFQAHSTLHHEKTLVRLRACTAHLRRIAVLWVENGHSNASDIILRVTSSDKKTVLDKVSGKGGKTG